MKVKKLKSIITMLLTVALVCSCIPLSMAFATSEPTITVEQVEVDSSATKASVKLSISNNTGFVGMRLTVEYDTAAMTLSNVVDSGLIGGKTHSNKYSTYPYTLYWQNFDAEEDITANGVAATLEFDLKAGLKPGSYEVKVTYNNIKDDIMNFDGNTVDFKIENGGVKVACNHAWAATPVDLGDGTHGIKCTKCGEAKDIEAHKGGTATCTKKAECSVCGAEYDD